MSRPPAVELLTPGEVAAMCRVDSKTVTRWAKAGKLAFVCTPGVGHRRYFAAEVRGILRGTPLTGAQVEALRAQVGGTS